MTYDIMNEYSFAMYFAMTMITAFYNIYLIVRIRYGETVITKTTLTPYYFSLIFLVLNYILAILRLYIAMYLPDADYKALFYYNNVDGDLIIAVTRVYDSFVKTFFVYFIIARIKNCGIMHELMVYQRGYRIQELEIVKDKFNRMERESRKFTVMTMLIYCGCIVAISFTN